MSTDKKSWISDRNFFWLVVGISLAVPAVVATLRFLPEACRPNALIAMHLPKVNAILNTMVSIALTCGYIAIRTTKNRGVHKTFMLTAFVLSAMFLVSYVVYHTVMPSTPFCGEGMARYFYLSV